MTSLICPVCGALLVSDGVHWDCPHAGQDKGSAYEPHYIDPFAREKGVKIRVRDRRTTTQNNMRVRVEYHTKKVPATLPKHAGETLIAKS